MNNKKLVMQTLRLARNWRKYDAEHLIHYTATSSRDCDNLAPFRAFFRKSKTFRRLENSGLYVEPSDVKKMTRELYFKKEG